MICDLACWAVDEHIKGEQRQYFGSSTLATDVYTLIVEQFLEKSVGFFFDKLVPPVVAGDVSSSSVCEGMMEKLADVFEIPQVVVVLAKRLEGGVQLSGLIQASLMGAALKRMALKSKDEATKQIYLGARVCCSMVCNSFCSLPTFFFLLGHSCFKRAEKQFCIDIIWSVVVEFAFFFEQV